LRPFGIKEIARTGRIAMVRGSNVEEEKSPRTPVELEDLVI